MMSKRAMISVLLGAMIAASTSACGGGGGDGNSGNGNSGGGGPTGTTYTVELTAMGLTDTRNGLAIDPTGLPLTGATATRDP